MLYKVLFESWFSLAFLLAFNIIRILAVEVQLCIKNCVGKITPFCIYRALSCKSKMHRIRKLCLTWDWENDEIRPFHLSVDKLYVRNNKKSKKKYICLMSLKRGIDREKGKKTPLITDRRVKALIGKARTWRLKDESFTYYYNMFRNIFISPSLLLRYITRHSWSFVTVCFPLSF